MGFLSKEGRIVNSKAGVRLPEGWQELFLKTLGETSMVSEACRASGIARPTAYRHRQDDEEFRTLWDEILERNTDVLEQIAVRRAAEGSDQLMMFLLRARRPLIYRENVQVDHQHNHMHGGEVTLSLTDGRQPIDIDAAKRREAAHALLSGETETEEDLPEAELEDETLHGEVVDDQAAA